jgi:outer membrane receptor protein involved in Fe transport
LSYDKLQFPANFRFAPLSTQQAHKDQLSPKGGIVWTPAKHTTLRFGYSQSIGGVGFDQSFRLEPTQIAGFNQSFRSLIPESVAGANEAATFETWSASVEQQIGSSTFAGISGELLKSKVDRQFGIYNFDGFVVTPDQTREKLNYREEALLVTLNQLIADEWAFGARYRVSKAILKDNLADIPDGVAAPGGFLPRSRTDSVLHQVNLYSIYNHPCGFFAQFNALWYSQDNSGYAPNRPGDDFWQFNIFAGYRFLKRRVEMQVGLLNLTDRDYRINPLNITPELPRHRMFMAGLKFNF